MSSTTSRARLSLLFVTLGLVSSALACSGGDADTSGDVGAPTSATPPGTSAPGPGSTPTDPGTTPEPAKAGPTVLSTAPVDGAKGVKSDAVFVVTFDRPMDAASVAGAYASAELPSDKVALSWNGSGDQLSITPTSPLSYAAGAADVAAKTYAVSIGTGAKDKGGLPLAKPLALTVQTLRRVTAAMPMTSPLTGRAASNGTFTSTVLAAGDFLALGGEEREARGLLTFVLTSIPEAGAEVEKATLSLHVASSEGSPNSLGVLSAEHVGYASGPEGYAAEARSATNTLYVGSINGAPPLRSANVTAMVKDDVANRAARLERTQIRLRHVDGMNGDGNADLATYDKGAASLFVTYLAP